MVNNSVAVGIGAGLISAILLLVMFAFGWDAGRRQIEDQARALGYAEYGRRGEFRWKDRAPVDTAPPKTQ